MSNQGDVPKLIEAGTNEEEKNLQVIVGGGE